MAFRSVGNVLRSPRKTQVQDASARQGRRRAVHPPLARLGAAAGLVGAPVRSAVLAARAPRRGDHAAAHRARPPWRRNLLLRQRARDQPRRDGRDTPRVHHQAGVPDLADSRLGDRPDLDREDRGSLIRRRPFAGFSTASTAWHYVESLFFLDWMSAGGLPSKDRPHALIIDWTLFIEVMFYGLVAVLLRPLRLAPAVATLAMIGVVALTSLAYALDPALLHLNYTSTGVLLIIVGRVFYLNRRGMTSNRATLGLFVLSFGLYLVLLSRLPLNTLLVPPYELLVTYLLSAAIFFSVMKLDVRRVARPVRFLADISYSVYM